MITPDDIDNVLGDNHEQILIGQRDIESWLAENGITQEAFLHACARLAQAMRGGMIEQFENMSEQEREDSGSMMEWVDLCVAGGMGLAFISGWTCRKKLAEKEDLWPKDDVVALGVLDTVAARHDYPTENVYLLAMEQGRAAFYANLDDTMGWVEHYFQALADDDQEEVDGVDYDRHIGPAVDRIEDWLYS